MLETGSIAPDMALEDTAGRPVRLAEFRDKKNVLVFFMRTVSCAICNNHVKDLVGRSAELAAQDIQVLIAVPDGRREAADWQAARKVPFPVVTGRRGTPHETIGLTKKVFGAVQQSGTILIDRLGVVRHAHGATMPTSSYDKKGLAQAIHDLDTMDAR